MSNYDEYITIEWRIHFNSIPDIVFDFLNTKKGREKFWSESANEKEGKIEYIFPGRQTWTATILERIPNKNFVVEYYDGSITSFELTIDEKGETELLLRDQNVLKKWEKDVLAGWVSVLMTMKGAVDFGIDLRNHYPERTWDSGYCNN